MKPCLKVTAKTLWARILIKKVTCRLRANPSQNSPHEVESRCEQGRVGDALPQIFDDVGRENSVNTVSLLGEGATARLKPGQSPPFAKQRRHGIQYLTLGQAIPLPASYPGALPVV